MSSGNLFVCSFGWFCYGVVCSVPFVSSIMLLCWCEDCLVMLECVCFCVDAQHMHVVMASFLCYAQVVKLSSIFIL